MIEVGSYWRDSAGLIWSYELSHVCRIVEHDDNKVIVTTDEFSIFRLNKDTFLKYFKKLTPLELELL